MSWLPTLSRWRHRRHPAVRFLQDWLTELGYDPGVSDGVYGRRSESAVQAFQRDQGLPVDGRVTRPVWDALGTALAFQRAVPEEPGEPVEFRIVARDEWGARAPKTTRPLLKHRPIVFIHHAADPRPAIAGEFREAQKFQNYHLDTKGWWDIAYNYLVTPSGRVIEGRGAGIRSGATKHENAASYSICFMGDFHYPVNEKPSDASISAAGQLIRWLIDHEWVVAEPEILGHRNSRFSRTTCPGDLLYGRMDDIRRAAGLEAIR